MQITTLWDFIFEIEKNTAKLSNFIVAMSQITEIRLPPKDFGHVL